MFGASAAFGFSFSFSFVACLDSSDDIWGRMNRRTFSGTRSRYRYRGLQLDDSTLGEFAGEVSSARDRVAVAHFLRFWRN